MDNQNTTVENASENVSAAELAAGLDLTEVGESNMNEQNEQNENNTQNNGPGLHNVGNTLAGVARVQQTILDLSALTAEEWEYVSKAVDKAFKLKLKAESEPVNPLFKRLLSFDGEGYVPGTFRVLVTNKDGSFTVLKFIDRDSRRSRDGFTVVRYKSETTGDVLVLDSRQDVPEWVLNATAVKPAGTKIVK